MIMSSKGGPVEYWVGVWASPERFTRAEFEMFRDSLAIYMKVLERRITPEDVWEGESH